MSLRYVYCLILCIFSTLAIAQPRQPFEGIITYLVKTEAKQKDNPRNKYYFEKYGDTLTIYYHKNGSERRVYNNTGSYGLDWEIYNKINNEAYSKWHGLDSVFYTRSADTSSALIAILPDSSVTILGKPCSSFNTLAIDLYSDLPVKQTLYYSGEEYIEPSAYKGRRRGHIDKFYEESESLFLRWDLESKYVSVTYEAISIDAQTIDPNMFIIPSGMAKIKK